MKFFAKVTSIYLIDGMRLAIEIQPTNHSCRDPAKMCGNRYHLT